jgi:hypothetical protein
MYKIESFELDKFGVFDIVIDERFEPMTWDEAKVIAKNYGKGYRLPLDFELEELFKSSFFRGLLNNDSYWSGTDTAKTRARSQVYRNGGDYSQMWFQPGYIEEKNNLNCFFLIKKSKKKKFRKPLLDRILELALYDSIRQKYHIDNYVKSGLNREKVFREYKLSKTSKKSFLTMLKWGGIKSSNLNLVKEYSSRILEIKLAALNELIIKKNTSCIIDEYLSNKDLRIKGVNLSFITKHLYFTRPRRFLIYDKFMINLHVAMLLDKDSDKIDKYFNKSKFKLEFSIRHKMNGLAYNDFLENFNGLFNKINEELTFRKLKKFSSIGEFEAFLFGENKSPNFFNPRFMINNFISENL